LTVAFRSMPLYDAAWIASCTLPSVGKPARPGSTRPLPVAGPSPLAMVFSATTTRGENGDTGDGGVRFGLPKMLARQAVGSSCGATARLAAQATAKSCWFEGCWVSAFSGSRQAGSLPVLQRPSVIVWRGRPLIGSTFRL
jgi:hypothetical protein